MSLPPYEPDGSLPALPAEEVTAKVLVDRYEVSKQTLKYFAMLIYGNAKN